MKNILKRNRQELILLLIILAVGGIIGGINPVFFSTPNLLDILSNMVIDGIFAFAVMLGIIIGIASVIAIMTLGDSISSSVTSRRRTCSRLM